MAVGGTRVYSEGGRATPLVEVARHIIFERLVVSETAFANGDDISCTEFGEIDKFFDELVKNLEEVSTVELMTCHQDLFATLQLMLASAEKLASLSRAYYVLQEDDRLPSASVVHV